MSVMVLILGGAFVVALVAILVVVAIAIWPKQGKLGINVEKVHCPRCAAPMPAVRLPKSANELAWGGWTCSNCGCKMDKYGAEVPGAAS